MALREAELHRERFTVAVSRAGGVGEQAAGVRQDRLGYLVARAGHLDEVVDQHGTSLARRHSARPGSEGLNPVGPRPSARWVTRQPWTRARGAPVVIMASRPAFCSPLNGVAAGVGLPHLLASVEGESNQKPTLYVCTTVGELGFSMNVSTSKMPLTLTVALPFLSLFMSD